MPIFRSIAYWLLIALWLVWLLPFIVSRRGGGKQAIVTVKSARWGMVLQGLGFFFAWLHLPSWGPPSPARAAVSLSLAVLGCIMGWLSVQSLGKQWRFDAALNPDHALVRSGPYRFVRHPIYASMLVMLVATALTVSHWIALCIGLLFYFVGTEIRVRVEDDLLRSRFGAEFEEYRRRVPAYLPGVR